MVYAVGISVGSLMSLFDGARPHPCCSPEVKQTPVQADAHMKWEVGNSEEGKKDKEDDPEEGQQKETWVGSTWTEGLTHIWFYLSLNNPNLRKYLKLKEPCSLCNEEGETQWKLPPHSFPPYFLFPLCKDKALLNFDVTVL